MVDSWHNFFYLRFDPGGSLMIDKPPLGLWLETLSVKVVGFHYWALALPQAVAGVAAVGLLFRIVRPRYGANVALAAAGILAISPVGVATARNNTFDTVTMLLGLLAAAALMRFVESARLQWLALCGVLLGLGFNVKMAEALLPLPAFFVYYLTTRPRGTRLVFKHAAVFVVPLIVVSFAWVAAVGLTPAGDRPVVYNGSGNSIWNLTFRYNGIDRVLGRQPQERIRASGAASGATDTENLLEASTTPARSPLRLLTGRLGSQLGWFLPLAACGLGVMVRKRPRNHQDVLWGTWLLIGVVYFSVAIGALPQYLEAISGPVALAAGLGLVAIVEGLIAGRRIALAAALVIGSYDAWLVSRWSGETRAVIPVVLVCLVGLVVFCIPRVRRIALTTWLPSATVAGALVIAPLAWSIETTVEPATGSATRYPVAGPDELRAYAPAAGGDEPVSDSGDPALRLLESQPASSYLVLTERALFGNAARYVLVTNRPVLTLDSFQGDQFLAARTIAALVDAGRLRYLELPADGPWTDSGSPLGKWFLGNCTPVEPNVATPLGGESFLYHCSPEGS
jgi:4-amino-4-deoxy-L-arabinose transferase-like glycosyltransferase